MRRRIAKPRRGNSTNPGQTGILKPMKAGPKRRAPKPHLKPVEEDDRRQKRRRSVGRPGDAAARGARRGRGGLSPHRSGDPHRPVALDRPPAADHAREAPLRRLRSKRQYVAYRAAEFRDRLGLHPPSQFRRPGAALSAPPARSHPRDRQSRHRRRRRGDRADAGREPRDHARHHQSRRPRADGDVGHRQGDSGDLCRTRKSLRSSSATA